MKMLVMGIRENIFTINLMKKITITNILGTVKFNGFLFF